MIRKKLVSIWILARKIEQVDAGEYDEEAAEERDGVDRVGCIESLEKDE